MTLHAAISTAIELIPESAPFSAAERALLNGFFSKALQLQEHLVPVVPTGAPKGPLDDGDDGNATWHDPAIALDERMKLATGRPLRRRMMAAMGQQDCGQCGYNCEDYANNIALQAEPRLNLCVPGGKATARMLKALVEEMGGGVLDPDAMAAKASARPPKSTDDRPGRSREKPILATLLSRRKLNEQRDRFGLQNLPWTKAMWLGRDPGAMPGGSSDKATYHIEFDLAETGLEYAVGDSFGVLPCNDPTLVDAILGAIATPADFPIAGRPIRDVLIEETSLAPAPDALFQLLSYITGGERRRKAQALAKGEDPDGDAETLDVLAALQKFSGVRPDPEALMEVLEPLQPRLYSISSSPKATPARLSLTVDVVRYEIANRRRFGVASTFLSERARCGEKYSVYVQQAHGFGLPADHTTPIIMAGPGTGVAPFRAFLYERAQYPTAGRSWLFFGHRHEATDFFYRQEIERFLATGTLTKLSTAWSRDSTQKVYIQDRMRENGGELYDWLEAGAHFYICGDAKRMAADVDRALHEIVSQHGKCTPNEAAAYVADLKKRNRYQADVY
jgi:sulfite reductase (NADPH) flavoprotein alpha-component